MSLDIDFVGGQFPVQGDGKFDGRPFYFRSRGKKWYIILYETEMDCDQMNGGQCLINVPYGIGEFGAGAMTKDEAVGYIVRTYLQWLNNKLPPLDYT